jgi:branched-chain amino acid aminotransferase
MSNLFLAEQFQLGPSELLGKLYDLDIYVNGEFAKGSEARISVWDHGLLYGDGIFEGIRAYNGGVFKLSEHLDRLFDSAQAIGLKLQLSRDDLREIVLETLRRNQLADAHIRIIVTRGVGPPGLDPRICKQPSVIVMAYPFPPLLGCDPVRVISSSIRRKSPYAVDARIKSLNYLDNILAKMQAVVAGVDDALMLDMNGWVAEASGANLFCIKNEVVSTPLLTASLPGITRATVIDLLRDMGYAVQERPITLGDLYVADEIFLTGTAAEVVPVGEVDGRTIHGGRIGEITAKLIEKYKVCVTQEAFVTPVRL